MNVTRLYSQKKDPARVNMDIDGSFFCGLSLDTIAEFGVYEGKELDGEFLETILRSELERVFFARCVNYISRAPKTEFQILRYMRELYFKKKGKWYIDISKELFEDIEKKTISKLKKYSYIDDRNFATLFVQSRLKGKPRGKSVLIGELMSKGVKKEMAEEVVNEVVTDEYTVLKKMYEKKYREEGITREDRKKIEFLLRKGFSWDLIEQFINDESTE